MKTVDYSYYIERYIDREMSDSEKLWFEKEIEGNSDLKKEVELRNKTDEILKRQDIISLRNKLSAIETHRGARIPVNSPKRKIYIGVAASLAVLLLIGSVAIISNRNLTTSAIMKRYYTEYKPAAGQRSATSEVNNDFNLGLEYFSSHDYNSAALFFSKVVENDSKDMYATLLNGIANFEESRYRDASKSLGTVVDDNKNLYIDQAQWYLVFCYLNTGEKEKARRLLNVIIDEGGLYAKKSKKILRNIPK